MLTQGSAPPTANSFSSPTARSQRSPSLRGPRTVRVVFTCAREPYVSDREMIAAVRAERLLEITSAVTERDRRHPLMGCELGGAYDRFRAVHDLVGHIGPQLGFDRDGEFAAWLVQERVYRGLARWALATELHGEHSVRWTSGELSDHKATLLDRDLIARTRVGLDFEGAPAAGGRFMTEFFAYAVDKRLAPFWLPFGLRPSKDGVTITDDGVFRATFGFMKFETPLTNIVEAHVTRNYRWWTAAGGPWVNGRRRTHVRNQSGCGSLCALP